MDATLTDKLKLLIRQRATIKSKVTVAKRNLDADASAVSLKAIKEVLEDYLVLIKDYDNQINELYFSITLNENLETQFEAEIAGQTTYNIEVTKQISTLAGSLVNASVNKVQSAETANGAGCSEFKLKLPDLVCDHFNGEGTTNLEYHTFISQFNNIIGNRVNLNNSTKLTYLKTYLKGYALKLVQNLQILDENYATAIELLEKEFLNKEALVDDLYRKLLELKPEYDKDFQKTKIYINDVKCLLSDLKIYGRDLLQGETSCEFISHIVFNKLPSVFRQELVRRLNNNFPDLNQIIDNYIDVVKTLNIKQMRASNEINPSKSFNKPQDRTRKFNNNSSLQQFSGVAEPAVGAVPKSKFEGPRKNCKFCTGTNHSMLKCKKYPSYESRIKRAKELNLCMNCSSIRHYKSNCTQLDFNCGICNSNVHITALCPQMESKVHTNWCMNQNNTGKTFILPTVLVKIGNGKKKISVRCLLDSGSQRSYLASSVIEELG